MKFIIIATNSFVKLFGNLCKGLCYLYHLVFPASRFILPNHATSWVSSTEKDSGIPKLIWQTNFTNRCTLPVYLNFLFNRLMTPSWQYNYVSTEDRAKFIKEHMNEATYQAYQQLTVGAAQADLWRLVVLYVHGGVYLDIDATLIWPLSLTLKRFHESLFIRVKKNTEITNYFLATKPGTELYRQLIAGVVKNINNYHGEGVYQSTGPGAFPGIIEQHNPPCLDRKLVCIQAGFTNEYFQYMDKPRGKWTHQDPNSLVDVTKREETHLTSEDQTEPSKQKKL